MTLRTDELAQFCERLGLSSQAQAVLEQIRSSPPSRRVGSGGKNVPVRYPSRKMGRMIQAESHTVELAGVYLMEHDPSVLEFWDQPNPPLTLHYVVKQKNGQTRTIGVLHTPDYFVIREGRLGWEEWKTEEELLQFARAESTRYVQDASGGWRCPPGEAVASPLGFYYHVRSSAEIDRIFERNLHFLSYYLREARDEIAKQAKEEVIALVTNNPAILLSEALKQMKWAKADDLYQLIATGQLSVDLSAYPLAEPERVYLWSSQEAERAWASMLVSSQETHISRSHPLLWSAGAPIVWDGRPWTILNTGETMTTLLALDGALIELPNNRFQALVSEGKLTGGACESAQTSIPAQVRERLMGASKQDLIEANRRYRLIKPVLDGQASTENTTEGRAMRRWVAKYRQTEQTCGYGYVGLLSNYHKCGNREPRFPENVRVVLDECIERVYENPKQKNKREVYGEFVNRCQAQGIVSPPSYKTFVTAINRRPRHAQVEKRQGERAAYPREPMYWELSSGLPRHGDRPFEIAHLDHTELDVQLVDSQTGQPTGRPWATFLTDAFSRRLLAVYLTFDEPSYRSCMMAMRECVHRHNRLPELVVVDWGLEFESTYFETLLARYECGKASRPQAKPRFGSVIERLFGTANTTFVHNLAGNTQVMKNVRQVTKSVDPSRHAVWTLGDLYLVLRCWAYEVYDTIEHPALFQTPREVFATGLLQSGWRPKRLIPYDEDFIFFTLPTTPKETAKLVPSRGVKINSLFYWTDAFLDHPELEKTQLPVRYDPYDIGHAYVSIKGQAVKCISEHYDQFKGRSERELHLAAEELRKRNQHHAQRFTVTAAKLAAFITSVEAHEGLLTQRMHDDEAKGVFALMDGQPQPQAAGAPAGEQRQLERPSSVPATEVPVGKDETIYDDF